MKLKIASLLALLIGGSLLSSVAVHAQDKVTVVPNRPTVSELKIRGRIQGQWAYSTGDNSNVDADAESYSTFEARRVRLGVQGKLTDPVSFLVEINALSSVDLDSAKLTYTANPEARISFGKGKPRFGYEENTSSASILTMERSRLTGLFNGGKPLGLSLEGSQDILSYHFGVYNGRSTSTSRMARDMDSYLLNASVGLNLNNTLGEGIRTAVRLDYLRSEEGESYYRYMDSVAASAAIGVGGFDISFEYMWGNDHSDRKTEGFYVMPSIYLIPKKFQAVLRAEYIKGDSGVSLGHNRYAGDVAGLYGSGNKYQAVYIGGNYYIRSNNLKFMGGVEFAENKGSGDAEGSAITLITGVRMQF